LNTSIQLMVAEEMRGRTMAIYLMAFTGGYPIGALIQGRIADAVGVQATVGGASLLLVVVSLYLLSRADLIDRLDADPADGVTDAAPPVSGAVLPAGR